MTRITPPTPSDAKAFARMAILANPALASALADGGVIVHHSVADHHHDQEGAVYVERIRDGCLANCPALTEYYRRAGLTGIGDHDADPDDLARYAMNHTYSFTFGSLIGSASGRAAALASLRDERKEAETEIKAFLSTNLSLAQ